MTTTPLAPKPDQSKKADIVHMLFAASLMIFIASMFSDTRTAEVIREWSVCLFALMFFIEFIMAIHDHGVQKKQDRENVNNKPDAV